MLAAISTARAFTRRASRSILGGSCSAFSLANRASLISRSPTALSGLTCFMIHLRHEIRLYSKLFGSVDVRCGTEKHSKIRLRTLGLKYGRMWERWITDLIQPH